MAQWNGQFTGNTHGTKVQDLEHMLRHATEVFLTAADDAKPRKSKAVKKLAGKLLNARLKIVKARLSETTPVEAKDFEKMRIQIEHLQLMERNLNSEGTHGILKEFGVEELAADDL